MATLTRQRSRVAYTISGNSPEVRMFIESAQKTHKAGAFCYPTSSGRMIPVAGTSNLSKPDLGAKGLACVATKDGGNYTNSTTEVPFIVINDDTVFLGNVLSIVSTARSTISYSMIGTVGTASFSNSGLWPCHMDQATGSIITFRGLFEDDAAGDTYGRVYFTINRACRAFK